MTISQRTCRHCVEVLAVVDYTEAGRLAVEQLAWLLPWWRWNYVVEMQTLFIQRTGHCTADIPGHSLWRIDCDIRSIHGAEELPSGILRTFSSELSSWRMFLDDEDRCQKYNCRRAERHHVAMCSARPTGSEYSLYETHFTTDKRVCLIGQRRRWAES